MSAPDFAVSAVTSTPPDVASTVSKDECMTYANKLREVTFPAVIAVIVGVLLVALGTALEYPERVPVDSRAPSTFQTRFSRTIGWLCIVCGAITLVMASILIPMKLLR